MVWYKLLLDAGGIEGLDIVADVSELCHFIHAHWLSGSKP
jgi:hypothetical protein